MVQSRVSFFNACLATLLSFGPCEITENIQSSMTSCYDPFETFLYSLQLNSAMFIIFWITFSCHFMKTLKLQFNTFFFVFFSWIHELKVWRTLGPHQIYSIFVLSSKIVANEFMLVFSTTLIQIIGETKFS